MNHLSLIIKREYFTKVRNKSFIVMTILSPIIMIAIIAIVAYLSQLNNDKVRTISVLDQSGKLVDIFKDTDHVKYNIIEGKSLDEAKDIVKAAKQYGLLYIGQTNDIDELPRRIKFFSDDSPSLTIMSSLEGKLENRLKDLKLQSEGVDINKINSVSIDVDLSQESFAGEKTSKMDNVFKLIFGGLAGYLLFMFIIIYGNMIMRSVIEEKTSRIIEVIISSVKPIKLMLGKIIGTSLAGVTQFVIWILLGGVLLTLVSVIFGVDLMHSQVEHQQELVNQALQNPNINNELELAKAAFYNLPILNLIVAFVMFFISGYLLYSSVYAAIGAAVDNETDTQQFMLPVIMPLVLAVYVGFFTVIEDPHGTVSVIFSYIPLTSPVVMLMRIPFGVPLWEQLLSLSILIGTFILVVWLAAKIYRVGILMYGKKPSYKELIKWIKY